MSSNLETTARHDPELCTEDHSVFIGAVNHNAFAVANAEIRVSARRPGRTTNLLTGWASGDIVTDDIIEPEGGVGRCYNFQIENDVAHSTLEWTATVTRAVKWATDKSSTVAPE